MRLEITWRRAAVVTTVVGALCVGGLTTVKWVQSYAEIHAAEARKAAYEEIRREKVGARLQALEDRVADLDARIEMLRGDIQALNR